MPYFSRRLALVFGCLILFPILVRAADESSSAERVKTALAEMHRWVGSGPNGVRWRAYLKSEQLEAQLAQGAAADAGAVGEIRDAYASSAKGLDRARFVAVRSALDDWLVELRFGNVADLPEATNQVKSKFAPLADRDVQNAKAELNAAVTKLDQLLARSKPTWSAGWKTYLDWQEVQHQLDAGDKPDLRVMQSVYAKYRANHVGLEMPQFMAVRDRLLDYMNAVYYSSQADLQQTYEKNLDELGKLLEQYATDPSGETASSIGRTLGWLENTGQAADLVRGVRRHYWQPNLFAHVSRRLVASGIEDRVDETTPVNDVILGTNISGTARMQGDLTLRFIPNDQRGTMNIQLAGTAKSTSVGYQGPVTVYGNGVTQVDASKQVLVDERGMSSLPAVAKCTTSTTVSGLDAPPLIRKIAWKKVGQSKGQAEWIASQHAAWRIQQRMDEQAKQMLAKSNESFQDKFRSPLLRRGEFPRQLQISTTNEHLHIMLMQANAFQLAAYGEHPALGADDDLAVSMHESLVSNFAEAVIGGETITDERLAEMMKNMTGDVPEELRIGPDKDPWSITFAAVRPVSAEFKDGTVTLAIRGHRFTRGAQVIRDPMEIYATYKLERQAGGLKLTRQGDVVADYVRKGRQSVTQITFKTFLKKKFEALFKEEIVSEGLKLPGQFEKAGKLNLVRLDSNAGWLAAGWQLPAAAAQTANATAGTR